MEPLIVLVFVTLALRGAGAVGVSALRSWTVALRGGLAAMFVLTGVVHFVWMRSELISMVPPALPYPEFIVTITGILELAGAAGLLLRPTVSWAAGGLTLLLVVMFPANIYIAVEGLTTNPVDSLIPRTLMQLVFLTATITVFISHRRRSIRRTPTPRNNS
ncbi:DoxX family protein [Bacillaceae bacterium Marseille-Q3522]|nr:DoxX family protein [Bacillaceae bacterium Marseille-Q3522]